MKKMSSWYAFMRFQESWYSFMGFLVILDGAVHLGLYMCCMCCGRRLMSQ